MKEEINCKYCNKIVEQGSRKPKHFCNKKCYFKWYEKTGGFFRAMKKYNSKPKNKRKNLIRAKKQWEKRRKPKPILFCEVCGKLLTGLKTNFCSEECEKKSPRIKAYHRAYSKAYQKKRNIGKRIKNLEADLERTIEKSKNATHIISPQKLIRQRATKRISRIKKTLKELKNVNTICESGRKL